MKMVRAGFEVPVKQTVLLFRAFLLSDAMLSEIVMAALNKEGVLELYTKGRLLQCTLHIHQACVDSHPDKCSARIRSRDSSKTIRGNF